MLYGSLGGGKLIKYIPYPVVSGYLSAVGLIIFLSQIPKFFGTPKDLGVAEVLFHPAHWNSVSVIVGIATIAGVVFGPKLTKAVPAPIIGLAGGMVVYFCMGIMHRELFKLDHNPLVIGAISASPRSIGDSFLTRWHSVSGLSIADLRLVIFPALTLSVLLSIDTLKTCVVIDALTRSRHNSNRELVGQGLGNLASAFAGGLPGAGTMGATMVNLNSGGNSRRSGVLEGAFALLALLLLSSVIGWVPIAALAGIMFVIAAKMFDWSNFQLLRARSTRLDFLVIAAVIIVAVKFDLIAAAGAGVGLAIMLFVREQIHSSVIHRKMTGDQISSKRQRPPIEREWLHKAGGQIVACELQGSLFFGTSDQLFTELATDLKQCRFLILDLHRVRSIDYTAAHVLELMQGTLDERGATMIYSDAPASIGRRTQYSGADPGGQSLRGYLEQVGAIKSSANVKLFETFDDALEWTEDQLLIEQHLIGESNQEQKLDLAEFELFKGIDSARAMSVLRTCVTLRCVLAGQKLFAAGEEGDELFLIRRGAIRIQLPLADSKHHNLACFNRGAFFGEMAFLDHGARSADAVAAVETELYVLSRRRFDEACRPFPILGIKLFARLAQTLALRLRDTDAEVRVLQAA